MKNKLFSGFIAAILLAATLLGGCGETKTPADDVTTAEITEEMPKELDLFAVGDKAYKIIRGENDSKGNIKAAADLRKKIAEDYGFEMEIKTDWVNEQFGQLESEYEILVGKTERAESAKALEMSEKGGYVICVIGKKVVINAPTEKLLSQAVIDFTGKFLSPGKALIPTDTFIEGSISSPIKSVTVNGVNIRDYRIVVSNVSVSSYGSPANVLRDYLSKYCASHIDVVSTEPEKDAHVIYIGKSAGNPEFLKPFNCKMYMKDGDIYICGGSVSDCEQAVIAFICKYLDKTGNIDLTIPEDGSVQFSYSGEPDWPAIPSLYTVQDKIIMGCKKLQHILEYDHANGKYYTYQNQGYAGTIDDARRTNNRTTNCVIAANWVCKELGFWSSGIFNIKYDGTFGCTLGGGSKTFANANFDIISFAPEGKTVSQLKKENNLKPGDIIFFQNHINIVIDMDRAFDGGRSNCEKHEVGSTFERWIGPNKFFNTKVGYILRAKDAE